MGFLSMFTKPAPTLTRLPSGCFTVDRAGKVVISTLPQAFSSELTREVAGLVLQSFRDAQKAQLPLSELVVHYASLKIVAREMRGGAIVFLTPQTFTHTQN